MLEEGAIKAIEAAINRGNDAEVKIVQGNVVVIEIQRKLLYKFYVKNGKRANENTRTGSADEA